MRASPVGSGAIDPAQWPDYARGLVKALFRHLLLALVTLSLTPGLVEAVHDTVHQLLEEQAEAHADRADVEDACPEHGCTPLTHHCSCCVSMPAMQTTGPLPPSRALRAQLQTLTPRLGTRGADGISAQLQRPPRV